MTAEKLDLHLQCGTKTFYCLIGIIVKLSRIAGWKSSVQGWEVRNRRMGMCEGWRKPSIRQFLSVMQNHRLKVGKQKLKMPVDYISCTVILSWFLSTLSNKNSSFCRALIILPQSITQDFWQMVLDSFQNNLHVFTYLWAQLKSRKMSLYK